MEMEFEPILCFARTPGCQTVNQVFEDIQDRMRTILGFCLSRDRGNASVLIMAANGIKPEMVEELRHWHWSEALMTTSEFDKMAAPFDVSIDDVLGEPRMSALDREEIQKAIPPIEGSFDPVKAYVVLSTMDKIDEIVKDRRDWMAGIGVKQKAAASGVGR